MNRLDEYFEKGRSRRREVSSDRVRAFLEKHGAQIAPADGGDHHRRMKRIPILAIAAALGGGGLYYMISETVDRSIGNQEQRSEKEVGLHRPTVVETYHCPTEYAVGGRDENSAIAPKALAGLPMLELGDGELARIGIERIDAPGIVLYQMHDQLEHVQATKLTAGSSDGFPDIDAAVPVGIVPLAFEPRLVTDDLGRIRRFAFSYEEIDRALADSIRAVQKRFSYLSDDGRISEALDSMNQTAMPRWFDELHRRSRSLIDFNRLIPIYIRARSGVASTVTGEICRPDLIIWLDPTPELIDLLPSDWRQRLAPRTSGDAMPEPSIARRDRATAGAPDARSGSRSDADEERPADRQRNKDGKERPRTAVAPDEIGEGLPRDSSAPDPNEQEYLGHSLPHATTGERPTPFEGIDSVELQPNPVLGVGALRLRLVAERRVAVSLHTVQGARIALLAADQDLDSGEHRLMLPFDGIPRGLYLLVVTTDRGEIVVRRVMVRQE